MPEILLVGLAECERRRLQSLREHREVLTHEACAELNGTAARVALLGGEDPATVLRSMQRLHHVDPHVRIAVVAQGAVLDTLRGLMRTAPDVPVDVDLWRLPREDLAERVATLCRQARQESALQGSLSAVGAPATGAGPRVVGTTLDAVLEHAPVGVVVTDHQHRILAWNPAAADLLGLQGRDLGTHVGGQFLTGEHVNRLVERTIAGEVSDPAGAVETVAGRDGAFLDVRAASTHLSDGREAVLVLVQDSTARHRAEEARDRLSAQVRMIGGISEALLGAVDEGEVLARVMRQVVPTLADWVELQLYDDRLNTRKVTAHHRDGGLAELTRRVESAMPHGMSEHSPSRQIARGSGPILLPEITAEMLARFIPDVALRRLLVDLGVSSGIAVPLSGRGSLLGSMVLVSQEGSPALGENELALAVEIGRRVGTALETLRLQQRQRALAEALQRSMLTDPPRPAGAQIEVRYRPAADEAQVGGDWYDSFEQPDGTVVLTVGDVVGHDFRAAAAMGQLRGLLRGIAYASGSLPSGVLTDLDAAVDGLLEGTTASAIVAEVKPADAGVAARRLVWSNAGHPPPLLRRAGGEVEVLDGGAGADLLLGVLPAVPRNEHRTTLERGDTLILYSDGLVERRGKDVDVGIAELAEHLGRLGGHSLGAVCDAVLDRMLPDKQEDDVALVAIRLDS